jgi:hypothetical protein
MAALESAADFQFLYAPLLDVLLPVPFYRI